MVKRKLQRSLTRLAKLFPVIALTGPRQSGKTTLARHAFPHKPYVVFEDPDTRFRAEKDPRGFLFNYPDGALFDEVQRAPQLFSYLQSIVDSKPRGGQFILTGSQNFLLHEKITQTLAGRVALLHLLPFSLEELKGMKGSLSDQLDSYIFKGFYPRPCVGNIQPSDWYPNYIETYLERDVRTMKNVIDLSSFQKFIKLCAGRIGQLLNLSSLANDCGITHNTAKAWLSVLEASFIIFLLRPHHKNFNKRLVKMPKLYFYDTGLVCSLLGLAKKEQLALHYLRGNLFENFVILELLKYFFNRGLRPNLFFWRDNIGHEIDCLVETGGKLIPIEIKAGQTPLKENFSGLAYWNSLAKTSLKDSFLIYGGIESHKHNFGNIVSWKNISDIQLI